MINQAEEIIKHCNHCANKFAWRRCCHHWFVVCMVHDIIIVCTCIQYNYILAVCLLLKLNCLFHRIIVKNLCETFVFTV